MTYLDLAYSVIGKIIVWGSAGILLTILLYFILRYVIITWTLIYVHVIREAGIKTKYKKRRLWKLKLFFRILFSFRFIAEDVLFYGTKSNEYYKIDFNTYIPGCIIYSTKSVD